MDEEYALYLLKRDLPNRSFKQIQNTDFKGKDSFAKEKPTDEYIYRVVAARGFESFEGYDELELAAFSYDQASKCAAKLKFNQAAMACADRSIVIYSHLIEWGKTPQEREKHRDNLKYSERRRYKASNILERNSRRKKQRIFT